MTENAVARPEAFRHYLDHASTTPMRPGAVSEFVRQTEQEANPSSLHTTGRSSRRAVEEARESIAHALDVRPSEVIFTSGGTESNNLAIRGIHAQRQAVDPARTVIVSSQIEHHAVLDVARALRDSGQAELVLIDVTRDGVIDTDQLATVLAEQGDSISLVTMMWANNETGVVQPIAAISELCERAGIPLHTDAAQAVAWMTTPASQLTGPYALSVSAHKFGGPVGIGALVRHDLELVAQMHGGGQEGNLRSGTLSAPLTASMSSALTDAVADQAQQAQRIAALRDQLAEGIVTEFPDAIVNGAASQRVPGILNVSIPGTESDALLMLLDAAGIECSAGSACNAGIPQPSHVLLAMGIDPDIARGSLRLSLGWSSTQEDVQAALAALPEAVERVRRATASRRRRPEVGATV